MDTTGHNFTLCVKGTDVLREKDVITPKGTVFLPNISIASDGIQYLTLLYYNIKQVTIFSAVKGDIPPPPTPTFPYTPQTQRIYSSLYKLLYQLRNQNGCQAPQKPKTSAPSQ